MRIKKILLFISLILALQLVFFLPWANSTTPREKLNEAFWVLKEIQSIPEKGIPTDLLKRARAIAIFPSVYKGGFIVGGSFGKGVLFARNPKTNTWHGPIFLTIGAGSLGWQIGVKATDLILVIMNERGLEPFFKGSVTLGGELGVSAGPVGRELEASTDITLTSEIYSYSRSKGFFAGISLEGAYIGQDYRADEHFWGRPYTPREILEGQVETIPPGAQRVLRFLTKLTQ